MSQLSCALSRGFGLPELRCATWAPSWRDDVTDIEKELFCGWAGARCAVAATAAGASTALVAVNGTTLAASASVPPPASTGSTTPGRRMMLQQRPQQQDGLVFAAAMKPAGLGTENSTAVAKEVLSTEGSPTRAPSVQSTSVYVAVRKSTEVVTALEERIVQYPSAVYDWRGSGPMGLDLTIWVNNSDAAVRTSVDG